MMGAERVKNERFMAGVVVGSGGADKRRRAYRQDAPDGARVSPLMLHGEPGLVPAPEDPTQALLEGLQHLVDVVLALPPRLALALHL